MQKQLDKNKNFPQYEGILKLTRIKGNITTFITSTLKSLAIRAI